MSHLTEPTTRRWEAISDRLFTPWHTTGLEVGRGDAVTLAETHNAMVDALEALRAEVAGLRREMDAQDARWREESAKAIAAGVRNAYGHAAGLADAEAARWVGGGSDYCDGAQLTAQEIAQAIRTAAPKK